MLHINHLKFRFSSNTLKRKRAVLINVNETVLAGSKYFYTRFEISTRACLYSLLCNKRSDTLGNISLSTSRHILRPPASWLTDSESFIVALTLTYNRHYSIVVINATKYFKSQWEWRRGSRRNDSYAARQNIKTICEKGSCPPPLADPRPPMNDVHVCCSWDRKHFRLRLVSLK